MTFRILTFPFEQLGNLLRQLSLSGSAGNTAAMVIYLLISLLPVIYLVFRILVKKKEFDGADIMLVISSVVLFVTLYLMINPGYIYSGIHGTVNTGKGTAMVMTFWAVIIGHVVMKMMKATTESSEERVAEYLKAIMGAAIFLMAAGMVLDLLQIESVLVGIVIVIKQIPAVFNIAILSLSIKLLGQLKKDLYSEEVSESAGKLGSVCKGAVFANIFLTIASNLVQLFLGYQGAEASFHVDVPLGSILLAVVVLLLSKYLAAGKRLKEENDLMI